MMKNILKYITIVALIISAGCSDDYLDKAPLDQFTTEVFFQTDEHALQAVNAAYDPFQFWEYYSNRFQYLGNIASDDAVKGGFGASDQAQFEQINNFTIFPDNVALKNRWQAIYVGIFRANIVLDNVPDIDMDETLKARVIAEAKFIRALNYFNLVVAFGGVPLIDRQLEINEQNVPRSTTAETWAFIEKDLNEAAADLPIFSDYSSSDLGRATSGAAVGLLGKALVYQQKWAEAETALKRITSGSLGAYDLVADYRSLFDGTNENSVESLFEIQFSAGVSVLPWATPADGNGSALNTTSGPQGVEFDGWGFNVPTQDLVDAYETTTGGGEDPRLSATVFRDGDVVNGLPYEAQSETGYRCKKYVIGNGIAGSTVIDSPVNFNVLRYADILLLLAEALNEQAGKQDEAVTHLNTVRNRAGLALLPTTGNGQATLRTAIQQERRIELALEGERFFDLVRTGEAPTVLAAAGFKAPKHNLMPIPQAEMDVNTALAGNQNPGYN